MHFYFLCVIVCAPPTENSVYTTIHKDISTTYDMVLDQFANSGRAKHAYNCVFNF